MLFELLPIILAICVAFIWLFIFMMKVRDHQHERKHKAEHGDSAILRKLGHFFRLRRPSD